MQDCVLLCDWDHAQLRSTGGQGHHEACKTYQAAEQVLSMGHEAHGALVWSYQIGAQIRSAEGKILLSLKPISIHVQRHFRR